MAIAFAQGNSGGVGSSSISVAFGSSQGAGNSNFVFLSSFSSGTPSVTDNNGNTYTQIGSAQVSLIWIYLYVCSSINSGSCTVTGSSTGSTGVAVEILEYSGVSSTQDGSTQTGTGFGTAVSSSSLSTSNANDLVLAGVGCTDNITFTAGTSYTVRASTTGFPSTSAEDQIVSSTGSFTGAFTANSNTNWATILVAFKAASGSSISPTLTGSVLVTGTPSIALQYETDLSGTSLVTGTLTTIQAIVPSLIPGTIAVTGTLNPTLAVSLSGAINVTGVLSTIGTLPPLLGTIGITGVLHVTGGTPNITPNQATPFPFYIYGLS